MRKVFIILLIAALCSCEYFKVKKISSETILKEELQTFNWNDVDEYPSFSECDASVTKDERKLCFQYTLTNHITAYLQNEAIIVTKDITDTINLNLRVTDKGGLIILSTEVDSLTHAEIPNIKELLIKSLDSLPQIFPAIKRGQQVTTEFKLPIIIDVN